MAKTIPTLISDPKKETFIEECVSQARKLQAAADLSTALSRIEEALSVYPREPRLIQIQESIQRDQQTQRRQFRRRDLEELRRMETEIDAAADAASKEALATRVRAITVKYSTDGEVLFVANRLLHRRGLLQVSQTGSAGSPKTGSSANHSATLTHRTPPLRPEPSLAATHKVPKGNILLSDAPPRDASPKQARPIPPASGVIAATVNPPTPPAPPIPPTQVPVDSAAKLPAPEVKVAAPSANLQQATRSKSTTLIGVSAAAAILITAVFLFVRRHPGAPVAQTPEVVPVVSAPAVSGPPVPAPATPIPAEATPPPALPALKLSSDTGTGKVTVDDEPPAELQDGQWSLDNLNAGEHKLKFKALRGETSFAFSTAAGAAPVVTSPVVSKGLLALVLSGMPGHLHVYASDTAAKVSLDGQAPLSVPKDGLDFPSISPGAHELAVTRGGDQYKLDVDSGPAPALSTFLESGRNLGALLIVAGQDKAKVLLNGKPQRQLTQGGQLRIPNLELKDYVVQVSKSGFQDPPQQTVRIRNGEQAKVIFNLKPPVPHLASLMNIQGGAPGATVLVDQTPVGTIQPDGTLSVSTVNPGDHIVELRKDHFTSRQLKKQFVAGAVVSIGASDAALEAAPAGLKITFAPADSQVALARAGEMATRVSSGVPLSLAAGSYTLTARTSDAFTRSSTIEVVAGQSKVLDLSLAPSGMSKWDDPSQWKQEEGSFVRKGGDFVMYGLAPTSGTFVFSGMLIKGHRLQWVLNYTDPNNYVLFQLDENNFYRTVVHNGQKGNEVKIPNQGEKKSFRTLQIRVSPNEIVHQIKQGESWMLLDRWTQPGTNLSPGKFGFYIPGNDQVALSTFAHYMDLNLH